VTYSACGGSGINPGERASWRVAVPGSKSASLDVSAIVSPVTEQMSADTRICPPAAIWTCPSNNTYGTVRPESEARSRSASKSGALSGRFG
jgi:hypothetical protein